MLTILKKINGRLRYIAPSRLRFMGSFTQRVAAENGVPKGFTVGYDNANVVDLNFDLMCEMAPWDYPVVYWLAQLLPPNGTLIDAGGHMGTKYRAFSPYLNIAELDWLVYDVPAVIQAGKARAVADKLHNLRFVSSLTKEPSPDVFLGSGLLQYADLSLTELLSQTDSLPKNVILNKVPLRNGPAVFTLENFHSGWVPYQIRNRSQFLLELQSLGYVIVDQWNIPSLTHQIATHPEVGCFENWGFCLRRNSD